MADDRHYVPGDHYKIDERTGFKVRASKMRKEWTGRYVDQKYFEMRQPQDFVRGRKDPQIVPDPRPRTPNVFLDPNFRLTQTAYPPNLFGIALEGGATGDVLIEGASGEVLTEVSTQAGVKGTWYGPAPDFGARYDPVVGAQGAIRVTTDGKPRIWI